MSATVELSHPTYYTIGEVRRLVGRSETAIRRMEGRGIVTPIRPTGDVRRLYTRADIETIRATIRERDAVRDRVSA